MEILKWYSIIYVSLTIILAYSEQIIEIHKNKISSGITGIILLLLLNVPLLIYLIIR